MDRRTFLATATAMSVAGFAGCLDQDDAFQELDTLDGAYPSFASWIGSDPDGGMVIHIDFERVMKLEEYEFDDEELTSEAGEEQSTDEYDPLPEIGNIPEAMTATAVFGAMLFYGFSSFEYPFLEETKIADTDDQEDDASIMTIDSLTVIDQGLLLTGGLAEERLASRDDVEVLDEDDGFIIYGSRGAFDDLLDFEDEIEFDLSDDESEDTVEFGDDEEHEDDDEDDDEDDEDDDDDDDDDEFGDDGEHEDEVEFELGAGDESDNDTEFDTDPGANNSNRGSDAGLSESSGFEPPENDLDEELNLFAVEDNTIIIPLEEMTEDEGTTEGDETRGNGDPGENTDTEDTGELLRSAIANHRNGVTIADADFDWLLEQFGENAVVFGGYGEQAIKEDETVGAGETTDANDETVENDERNVTSNDLAAEFDIEPGREAEFYAILEEYEARALLIGTDVSDGEKVIKSGFAFDAGSPDESELGELLAGGANDVTVASDDGRVIVEAYWN